MADWVDHYRVLQVDHEAEKEIIEAAYRKLAAKYHPDVNKGPGATEKMRQFNAARDVLTDPLQRADYDALWRSHQPAGRPSGPSAGPAHGSGSSGSVPPRPIVEPSVLTVEAAEGRPGRASFTLKNTGGPYGRIGIQVAGGDSFLQVLGCESLTSGDELPMRVTVEAHSNGGRSARIRHVQAYLDAEVVDVNVVVVPQYSPAGNAGFRHDTGGSTGLSGWLGVVLRAGMVAAGTLLLAPGMLLDIFLLLIVLTPLKQSIPDAATRTAAVIGGAALSLLVVAPGAALLRRGLSGGAGVEKWWPLTISEVKEAELWWLPLGLGVLGGLYAWKRARDVDRGLALKMLTWGIAVSVLQPVAAALLSIIKPA